VFNCFRQPSGQSLWNVVGDRPNTGKDEREQRIKSYVQGNPQYRPLLKHKKEALDAIAQELPDGDLDLELYKINLTYDSELREKSVAILSTRESGKADPPTFEEQYKQFTSEWNELGMSSSRIFADAVGVELQHDFYFRMPEQEPTPSSDRSLSDQERSKAVSHVVEPEAYLVTFLEHASPDCPPVGDVIYWAVYC
jgi:hypothetical protein